MSAANLTPRLHLRVVLGANVAFGPGKADLLEGVRETGSIAAAGRRMKMSYKRAWLLIDELNQMFDTPLVDAARGGREGGGARLTARGEEVLRRYRQMEAICTDAAAENLRAFYGALRRR